jgi:flagellar M-ring protein FliF
MDKVKDSFSKTFSAVKEKWTGIAGKTRVVILAVAGVVVVSAIVITALLNTSSQIMLCRTAGPDEALEVQAVLATAGIVDVRVNSNDEIFIPSNLVGAARVALSEAGLPRPGFNYDVWNNGVGMFSTNTQMRETQKQQLQENIRAHLSNIPEVSSSMVILHIPQTANYVMVENREESRASVSLTLRTGQTLSNDQIKGIHQFILTSVPEIKEHNITVNDGSGILLIPDDLAGIAGDNLALEQQKLTMQAGIISLMADNAELRLNPLLTQVFGEGGHALAVNVEIDFSTDMEVYNEVFTPVEGIDGEAGGIIRDIQRQAAAGGIALEGGLIGFPGNADIGPDFPTIPEVEAGGEFYVEWGETINYEMNRRLETYKDTGLRLSNTTASLVVNSEPMTPAEIEAWEGIVANATGANQVQIVARVFALEQSPGLPGGGGFGDMTRNILIYIIVALGVLLVILFVLAITTSSSKKKRLIRNRGVALAADGAGGYLRDDSFQPLPPENEAIELQSLLEETDTKDVVLKREIREFSRSNPEIIAQLIRTWLRSED